MNEKRNENNVQKERMNEIPGSASGENTQPVDSITSGKYEETHFIDTSKPVWNYSMLTDEDVVNYQQGTHYKLYEKFGHTRCRLMISGECIAVYGLPMLRQFL